jgi:hypothetical protein
MVFIQKALEFPQGLFRGVGRDRMKTKAMALSSLRLPPQVERLCRRHKDTS